MTKIPLPEHLDRFKTASRFWPILVLITLFPGPARAQDLTPVQTQGPVEDVPTPGQPSASADHFVLGIGAVATPAFEGRDSYRILPLPVIDIAYGRLYANLRNGIGVNLVDTRHLTLGGGFNIMQGYRTQDVPKGIGSLDVGFGPRAFATVSAGGAAITIGATKGIVGNNRGVLADASLSYTIVASPRTIIIPSVGATWGDSRYNDRYFGVDIARSSASGLRRFRAGSGFKDVSALLTVNRALTRHVMLGVSGGLTRLVGSPADSPLVKRRTQPFGFLSIAYAF